jgi:hypothetical protein
MGLLLFTTIVTGSFVMAAFHYWRRLCDEELTVEEWRLFLRWSCTGIAIPFVLWLTFNTGLLGAPVWPYVAPISAGVAAWWKSFAHAASAGLFFISSYWAGVTFAWLLWRVSQRVGDRGTFYGMCLGWSFLLVPVAVVVLVLGGWGLLGMAMLFCGLALVHTTLELAPAKAPMPSYSRALAKINFGKYDEAELEVIRELEECENDFDGWMMLAELYATHFDDLPGADQTVRDLCEQPTTTPGQVAVALHRLADWHLKLAHDPVAARHVLERICSRLPGTHMDKMARLRINQLPATRDDLLERESGKPLRLPHVPDDWDPTTTRTLPREEAVAAANDCVEALKKNPDDVPAREKFARLLAESVDDAKTAIEQLELLLSMPNQPVNKRGEWLMTIAGWHARYRDDVEMARLVYQEVMRDFPQTAHAFAAQRRLNLLNLQAQFRRRFAERAAL